MYRDFDTAKAGFTRSLFAFFTHHVPAYVLAWLWIAVVFLEPFLVLALDGLGFQLPFFPLILAWIMVLQSIVLFLLIYWRFRFPIYLTGLYPISISIFVWLAFRSLIAAWRGNQGWKDRGMARPDFRL
jgi:hypothetical protein